MVLLQHCQSVAKYQLIATTTMLAFTECLKMFNFALIIYTFSISHHWQKKGFILQSKDNLFILYMMYRPQSGKGILLTFETFELRLKILSP